MQINNRIKSNLEVYKDKQRRFIEKHGQTMSEFYAEIGGKSKRNIEMLEMFGRGRSYADIGQKYNLTRGRVRQIICRFARAYVKFLNPL